MFSPEVPLSLPLESPCPQVIQGVRVAQVGPKEEINIIFYVWLAMIKYHSTFNVDLNRIE